MTMVLRVFAGPFVVMLLSSCTTAVGPGEPPDGEPDGEEIDDLVDAGSDSPRDDVDAASFDTTATVTANCLFLREGPGTDRTKVRCAPNDSPCNADGDVCMPVGSVVTITGDAEPGQGCTEWFPVSFARYQGFCCGEYLELSEPARQIIIKGPTRYPDFDEGPMG